MTWSPYHGFRVTLLTVLVMPLVTPPKAPADSTVSRPAIYTCRQIQEQVLEINQRVRAFHVVYESMPQAESRGAYVHRELGADSPSRFFHLSAKGSDSYSHIEDPFQQRLIVNGTRVVVEHPLERSFTKYQLGPQRALPEALGGEILFLVLGWWPLDSFEPPAAIPGTALVFPQVGHSTKYVVQADQSLLRDRWCHVLEDPGRERMWLDVERGCAILAREVLDPDTGAVVERIEAFDHSEIVPGIWVPGRFRNLLFDPRGQVESDALHLIRRISINRAPRTESFEFEPQPGSIELLGDGFEQRVPGGTDLLDDLPARIKRYGLLRNAQGASSPITSVTVAINVVSSLCVIALCAPARFRRVKRPMLGVKGFRLR